MSPLVSIVIPSKNQSKYVKATLDALQRQTFQDFEVIFIDAFSTDGTEQLLADYHKVHVVKRLGHACAAWEYGINNATGKYLMLGTTSDYLFNPQWIARGIRILESDPELSMVWSSAVTVNEEGELIGCWGSDFWFLPPPKKEAYLPYWFVRHYVPELNYIVRREVYLACLNNNQYGSYSEFDIFHHIMFNFTRLGYLQAYVRDFGHAGREHKNALGSLQRIEIRKAERRVLIAKLRFLFDLLASRAYFAFRNSDGKEIRKLSQSTRTLLPAQILIHFSVVRFLKLSDWTRRRIARFVYKLLRVPR